MVDSKPLIQIKPDYTRVLKKIKAGAEYSAQIPTMEPNVHDFENPRPAWPVNKTVCLYQVEPWSFSLSAPTMKRLYDWCSAKNLSLLEYGYCIVTEQTDNGDISYHRACFLFKKLKHALISNYHGVVLQMKLTESFNPDFPIAFTLSEIERTEVQTLMNQNIFEEWCDTVLGPSGYTTEENTVLISDLDAALKFKLRWELEEVIE